MKKTRTASTMLDREFLEIRCRLIDIAAGLDRVDRCDNGGASLADPRRKQIAGALAILVDGHPDRARRVQMIFSDPYDASWRGSDGEASAVD